MSRALRIGDWHVRPDLGRLCRGNEERQLEPKAMQVLMCLAEHPGEVLSKDKLLRTVWSDAFVTDEVLSTAIWQLRRAFGDDSRHPRFIETLARRGYRLIAEVDLDGQDTAACSAATGGPGHGLRHGSRARLTVLCATLILAGVAGFGVWYTRVPPTVPLILRASPLTSYTNSESRPDFSPTGDRVAFQWAGADFSAPNSDIYIKLTGPGDPFRLTSSPEEDTCPRWAPDGKWIVFGRLLPGKLELLKVPALGGAERYVAELTRNASPDAGFSDLSWSPDGRELAVSFRPAGQFASRCCLMRVEDGKLESCTEPPGRILGDYYGQISQGGKSLAFFRRKGWAVWDLYVQPLPAGQVQQLTFRNFQWARGLAWMPDGRSIVFSAGGELSERLWRIELGAREPEPLTGLGENLVRQYPSIARQTGLLAYAEGPPRQRDIWRVANPDFETGVPEATCIVSSTRPDDNPAFAPDGQRIVFGSLRTGFPEIFICDADGGRPSQLTDLRTYCGAPAWSPDGRRISFDSWTDAAEIYVVNAGGGAPRRLTEDPAIDVTPSWSSDGRWIYFGSDRSGRYETWKVRADGGEAIQVTRQGGFHAKESADGRRLYYTKDLFGEIWTAPVDGGPESRVLDRVIAFDRWGLAPNGLYFRHQRTVYFIDFEGGRPRPVMELTIPGSPAAFTVSPDGHWFVFSVTKPNDGTDIMLVEGFR